MVKRTFNQVVTRLKQNKHAVSSMWAPMPFRGTRRELVFDGSCGNRNITLVDFTAPGRSITSTVANESDPIEHILVNNPDCCTNNQAVIISETNAKLRHRSTGNLKNEFALTTQTYLEKSGKAESKNSFSNYRVGDGIAISDAGLLIHPLYKPGKIIRPDGKLILSGAPTTLFQYQWINGLYYDVIMPAGTYDIEAINLEFRNTMFANKHYLIDMAHSNQNIFFMRFVYDSENDRIQIQCKGINNTIYSSSQYKPWTSYDLAVNWTLPEYTLVPCVVLINPEFSNFIGFESGSYPPQQINPNYETQPDNLFYQFENYFVNNAFYYANGANNPRIKSKYVPFVYRPLNSYFGENGAVSSSSFISKKKFNTVTRSYGNHLSANYRQFDDIALAYNVAAPGYSLKYIRGFDDTCYTNCH